MLFLRKPHGETSKPVQETHGCGHVCEKLNVSQRRACKILDQARTTQRRRICIATDEKQLTEDIIRLAAKYGRYGYRRITVLLQRPPFNWQVNHKRVERIWRREGLKVPQKQPKRGRLWLTDGSCIRLRPAYKNLSLIHI